MEHRRLGPDQAGASPTQLIAPPAATASRPAACCTTARASGIRASPCRAGRSASTGARDGQPVWRGASRRRAARPSRRAAGRRPGADRAAGRAAGRRSRPTSCRRCEDPLHCDQGRGRPARRTSSSTDADDRRARRRATRLRRAMRRPVASRVGYVLPLRRCDRQGRGQGWVSEAWRFGAGGCS